MGRRKLAEAEGERKKQMLKDLVAKKKKLVDEYEEELKKSKAEEQRATTDLQAELKKGPLMKQHVPSCEWMFGDAGAALGCAGLYMSHFNPFRWSDAITVLTALQELEDVAKKEPRRKIVMKIPAGLMEKEQTFAHVADAVSHLTKLQQEDNPAVERLHGVQSEKKKHVADWQREPEDARAALKEAEA